jgi:formate-dependent phosphoribosylglycinamide formyltransferase (GAR transformylase)
VIPPAMLLYAKKMETSQKLKSAKDVYQLMPKETLRSLIEDLDPDFALKVINAINQRIKDSDAQIHI